MYAATVKMQLETVLLKLMNLVYCYFWGGCILVGFGINILTFILVVEQTAIDFCNGKKQLYHYESS